MSGTTALHIGAPPPHNILLVLPAQVCWVRAGSSFNTSEYIKIYDLLVRVGKLSNGKRLNSYARDAWKTIES
eukprot:COSAG01_NODE_8829_length_2646_cov_1.828818_4_plen_72_part_00